VNERVEAWLSGLSVSQRELVSAQSSKDYTASQNPARAQVSPWKLRLAAARRFVMQPQVMLFTAGLCVMAYFALSHVSIGLGTISVSSGAIFVMGAVAAALPYVGPLILLALLYWYVQRTPAAREALGSALEAIRNHLPVWVQDLWLAGPAGLSSTKLHVSYTPTKDDASVWGLSPGEEEYWILYSVNGEPTRERLTRTASGTFEADITVGAGVIAFRIGRGPMRRKSMSMTGFLLPARLRKLLLCRRSGMPTRARFSRRWARMQLGNCATFGTFASWRRAANMEWLSPQLWRRPGKRHPRAATTISVLALSRSPESYSGSSFPHIGSWWRR